MSSRKTCLAERMLTPLRPVLVPIVPLAPVPLQLMLRSRTVCSGSLALTVKLMVKQAVAPLARTNAGISWQSTVIDLVIVSEPKPPGSRHLISPLMNVLEIAPANVLQGAVRLHGLTS